MPKSSLFSAILLLLLSSSPQRAVLAARGGPVSYSVPSTARPPVDLHTHNSSPGFVTMDPSADNKRGRSFGGREVKNCLPKGFRHTSAPSRFVNYEPLGSSARCSPEPKDLPVKH
ncbi:hypothetical protein MLD38_040168 [Melastoma candidum]|uniref:Uncharacterized protein n=1 Tax=Melastoma candidum TaxID=119954 RepID=A0ACB9L6L6_9MYRT|nr:hypothetical protein MLD38_040168 [Melastoma candidum]